MTLPRAPARLSDDMAQAIGHAVSGFGFLEEALKRAIFSLTLHSLGRRADDRALETWLRRMEDIADDTLGTLVDAFVAAMKQAQTEGRGDLAGELREIRRMRNLICHASWRPGSKPGSWRPTFINTRGEHFPDELDAAAVTALHERTLAAARRIIAIMRATGIEGEVHGIEDGD